MLLVVELCLCLSKVLTVAHSVREPAASESRDLSRKALQIWECKKDLETWSVKAVASSRVMAGTEPGHHRHGKPQSSILMFANLVWIYYHSARITLCSSELLLDAMSDFCIPYSYAQHSSMAVEKTHVELWDTATNITQRLGQLLKLRLAHCLPSSAVCCTALPLALHLLDARLSATDHYKSQSKRVERQNALKTLISAMREFHPRHEEADWITRAIRYFMECTYFEPAPSFRETNGQGPDTEDVISQNPVHYLKLALTLDLSLSQDQLPVEKDFPAKIQALIIRTGCFMPIVFSVEGEDDDNAAVASPEEPPSELEQSTVLCVSPRGPDLAGWIQNDRDCNGHGHVLLALDVCSAHFPTTCVSTTYLSALCHILSVTKKLIEMAVLPGNGATCTLSIIDTTCSLTVPADTLVEPTIPGHELLNLPTFSFLIAHDTTRKQLLFDLGCRKDFWNLPDPIAKTIDERVPGIRVDNSLVDILQQGDIDLSRIEAAIISHHHYDHIGDPSTFPETMDLIVGPGFCKHFVPGYPKNPNSPVHESAFKNRAVREIEFEGHIMVAGHEARDYFGDGSLFLLNTPGHAIGHLSALLRREEVALPHSAPELVSREDSWYINPPEAHKSVSTLMTLDADDKVLVLIAHDPSILGVLPLFPKANINQWHRAEWKQLLRWRFLDQLPINGQPRPHLVDGTYVDARAIARAKRLVEVPDEL
ncbi:hypothetical protein FDECE_11700 [Fusarium decemcellulare]|nr:hypothetical protein FDECE_11700 [Fusarium decemcellulare]